MWPHQARETMTATTEPHYLTLSATATTYSSSIHIKNISVGKIKYNVEQANGDDIDGCITNIIIVLYTLLVYYGHY